MTAAKPEVNQGKKFTAVWIIPLVAIALGAWMVVYTYLNEGPEIEITFKTANSLEAGATRVKFRNIDMGTVTDVSLSPDLQNVIVTAKLNKDAEPLLNADTRFWVVRARIGGGGITGLDTLLSGAYIQIAPGTEERRATRFVGLEAPPPTEADAPGKRLVVISDGWADLSSGDQVLYKGFTVGRIESVEFDPEKDQIRHVLFVDAPYDELLNTSTRFWNVSGISVSTSAAGLRVSMGSLDTLLHGGVTFGVPEGRVWGLPIEADEEFYLFESEQEARDEPFKNRLHYVVMFEQSLRGLQAGAPVEYNGIRIGTVERIMIDEVIHKSLRTGKAASGEPLPVLIYLEPAQLSVPDTREWAERMNNIVEDAVSKGMHAVLKTGNLISGAKYVEFVYLKDEPAREIKEFAGYPVIPASSAGFELIEHKAISLLDKLNNLEIEKTISAANEALKELNQSMVVVRGLLENPSTQAVPRELESSLVALRELLDNTDTQSIPKDVRDTVESLRVLLDDESLKAVAGELEITLELANSQLRGEAPETYQLNRTLQEVEAAARALREFLDLLETKPEALISGKDKVDP